MYELWPRCLGFRLDQYRHGLRHLRPPSSAHMATSSKEQEEVGYNIHDCRGRAVSESFFSATVECH